MTATQDGTTTDIEAFRREARAWLAERLEPAQGEDEERTLGLMGAGEGREVLPRARAYLAMLSERGWGAPGWPVEYGGAGLSAEHVRVLAQVLREFDTPDLYYFSVGLRHAGTALLEYGSEEQKRRWLPKIANGEEIWAQVFSEPGAGSDLAALSTRAERDTDVWRVNGQKVWVSRAHLADWGLLLTRTNPDVPKHRGITAFGLKIDTDGVDVRPLKQANGDEHFNEIFFDDATVPDENRIGEEGDGWRVALTMLAGERRASGAIGTSYGDESVIIDKLVELVRRRGLVDDESVRQDLAALVIDSRLTDRVTARAVANANAGKKVGAEGSGDKLRKAAMSKQASALALGLLGAEGMTDGEWHNIFITAPSISIRGGTDQILLNVIGERVLGLPGEPRVDKDMPFSEVPR